MMIVEMMIVEMMIVEMVVVEMMIVEMVIVEMVVVRVDGRGSHGGVLRHRVGRIMEHIISPAD